jgi:hypothetical protein
MEKRWYMKIKIQKVAMFQSLLYDECETWWSLTLMEEHKLRVFEERALRNRTGPMRVELKERWRKLHNEELRDTFTKLQ